MPLARRDAAPIFTELAAEVIERTDKQAVVKHPNTKWRLVIHEGSQILQK